MNNLKDFREALDNAKDWDEVKEIKIQFGFYNYEQALKSARQNHSDKWNKNQSAKRSKIAFDERKALLKKHLGETVYYVGADYKELKKNKPCKLLQVNRKNCLVEFRGNAGQWNIPIMEVNIEKTTQMFMSIKDGKVKFN